MNATLRVLDFDAAAREFSRFAEIFERVRLDTTLPVEQRTAALVKAREMASHASDWYWETRQALEAEQITAPPDAWQRGCDALAMFTATRISLRLEEVEGRARTIH